MGGTLIDESCLCGGSRWPTGCPPRGILPYSKTQIFCRTRTSEALALRGLTNIGVGTIR